jgi:hypothetical protein
LDTLRIVRDLGYVSSLVPDGYFGVWDLPFPLLEAVNQSLYFLRFDEIQHVEDTPPKKIWFDADAMRAWWVMVEDRMRRRAKGEEVSADDTGDQEPNAAAADLLA